MLKQGSNGKNAQGDVAGARALIAAGRLGEAEASLGQILARRPDDPAAMAALVEVYLTAKRLDLALPVAERGCAMVPGDGTLRFLLGTVHAMAGRGDMALSCFEQAVRLAPRLAVAHYNLGLALHKARRLDDAAKALRKASQLVPNNPDFTNSLGCVLAESGNHATAQQVFRKALLANPGALGLSVNLANSLLDDGKADEALKVLSRLRGEAQADPRVMLLTASAHKENGDPLQARSIYTVLTERFPQMAEGWINFGTLNLRQGLFEEALVCFERAGALAADLPLLRFSMGMCLFSLARYDQALPHLEAALERQDIGMAPRAQVQTEIALCLQKLGRGETAMTVIKAALAEDPSDPKVNSTMAEMLMRQAKFQQALPYHQARREGRTPMPDVDAGSVAGRNIRVVLDQGVGDQILQAGLARRLFRTAGSVELVVEPRLVTLLKRSLPEWSVVEQATASVADMNVRGEDLGVLAGDLPGAPFLVADPERVSAFRRRLEAQAAGRAVVGVSWFSANALYQRAKSLSLSNLAPVLARAGVLPVNLQYGDHSPEIARFETEFGAAIMDFPDLDLIADLDGFAALVAAMDHVVTISNATAHFAGALGVPGSVLLDVVAIWHWGDHDERCRYYPSLRLLRQSRFGDWSGVINAIGDITAIPA